MTTLDTILAHRFHGAVNVRGIRFQVLYSLLRAFELFDYGAADRSLRLEGLEDLDLLGFHLNDTYVQVKTSDTPWNWAKLKEPIKSFLELLRVAPDSRFLLAASFSLRGDIQKLSQHAQLPRGERKRLGSAFKRLCRSVGGTASEAEALLNRLQITSQSEDHVWQVLRREVANHFELGSQAVDTYVLVLVARFLEWAQHRKTLTRLDLDAVRRATGESLAQETQFQAYGRGLITRVEWSADANLEDFYDGKATRPGHVGAGADIRRERWLHRIAQALAMNRVCILRSPSGQGKSTLLYRYALESWPSEQVVTLRVAETPEQVELIRHYLSSRASLGLPLLLLVDNAAQATRLWPQVIERCAAIGVSALIAIRTEDWHRYSKQTVTNYEVIEPDLDLKEARQLFSMLKTQGRVHPSVTSADWAFEKVGEPHLLMEFAYLVTHGCMLEDRLRDQLQVFNSLGEDPAKTEILRRSSLADTLGASVSVRHLLEDVKCRDDAQAVLKSLEGEYLRLEHGQLHGLHWVRSHHLARILHQGYPARTATALAVLPAVPEDGVATFIANALADEGADVHEFLGGLVERALRAPVDSLLEYVDGIFEGGERLFFNANRRLFDEAYQHLGDAGPFILTVSLTPILKKDIAGAMASSLGDDGAAFRFLAELATKANDAARGLDLVKAFLEGVAPRFSSDVLASATSSNGEILNWASLCRVRLPEWPDARSKALVRRPCSSCPRPSLLRFCLASFDTTNPPIETGMRYTAIGFMENWRWGLIHYRCSRPATPCGCRFFSIRMGTARTNRRCGA